MSLTVVTLPSMFFGRGGLCSSCLSEQLSLPRDTPSLRCSVSYLRRKIPQYVYAVSTAFAFDEEPALDVDVPQDTLNSFDTSPLELAHSKSHQLPMMLQPRMVLSREHSSDIRLMRCIPIETTDCQVDPLKRTALASMSWVSRPRCSFCERRKSDSNSIRPWQKSGHRDQTRIQLRTQ